MINIKLTAEALDLQSIAGIVTSDSAGGTCIFIGTVRDRTKGKPVLGLTFEAYEPMAVSEMQKIAESAAERWPILALAIYHRTGALSIGDIPVVIAVSAAHRRAAFEACQYCIDTLKETVPIWKKEIFTDGEEWVSAHP